MKKHNIYVNIGIVRKGKVMEKIREFITKLKINRNSILKVLLAIVTPLITIFLTEDIQRQSWGQTFNWMISNIGYVLLNFLILYFIFYSVQLIFNKTKISFIVTNAIYFIISTISHFKYEVRGEVLLVNDFSLINQAEGLLSFIEPKMFLNVPIIGSCIFVIGFMVLLHFLKSKFDRKKNLIVWSIISIIMFFTYANQFTSSKILNILGLDTEIRYNMNSIYEKEGVFLGLYSNIIMSKVQKPNDYSREKVFELLDGIKSNNDLNSSDKKSGDSKPNIIMIMSESFFDPTVLEKVKFSEDPMPNIRKLIEEYTSGKFISSTFAGGTSNIEFEAFTGQSIAYLPYGTVPYTDLTTNIASIDTLPKIMKANSYKTVALHTYDKTFYDRDKNYKNMGFDEFIGIDELHEPKYFGRYVSDDTFVNNIIKILEDNSGDEDATFIWGITMQNHTPYSMSNYNKELDIKISGESLTEEAKDRLTAYVNGIYESDKATQKLIEYLEDSDKPTILLFFGDHLPSQYEAYFDTGLIHTKDTTKWNVDEMFKLHTVPFFIYDNYDYKDNYSQSEMVGTVFLGNYLCDYIGLQKPIYFDFLDTLTFKAIRDRLFVDKNGVAYEKPTSDYLEAINNHKILQYDTLYGEKYIREYEDKK